MLLGRQCRILHDRQKQLRLFMADRTGTAKIYMQTAALALTYAQFIEAVTIHPRLSRRRKRYGEEEIYSGQAADQERGLSRNRVEDRASAEASRRCL